MSTVLREMLESPGIYAAPGAYDPLSARLAEGIGFKALDLPGSALGYATALMEPNLSLEKVVEATRSITAAVNIPLVVDAGAGFGEPAHVFHMVREFEHVERPEFTSRTRFTPSGFTITGAWSIRFLPR